MLRILVCCAGGMSSGILAKKLQKDADTLGVGDRVHAECRGFKSSYKDFDKFDIVMCCPHQRYEIPKMMAEHGDVINIPLTVIPPRMYGTFRLEDIVTDAVDLIEVYLQNHENPCHFPDEGTDISVQRSYSHRRCVEKLPNDVKYSLDKFEKLINESHK